MTIVIWSTCITFGAALFLLVARGAFLIWTVLERGAKLPSERRVLTRVPVKMRGGLLSIVGKREGKKPFTTLDMTQNGAKIRCPRALPDRTRVYVVFSECQLEGSAIVRHCHRSIWTHIVGLEFTGRLLRTL